MLRTDARYCHEKIVVEYGSSTSPPWQSGQGEPQDNIPPKTMSKLTAALLLAVVAPTLACHVTYSLVRSVETVVPEEAIIYEVVAPVPSTLKVENDGDAPVVVTVREKFEGPDVMTLQVKPGASRSTPMAMANFYVILIASPDPSFVSLSVNVVRQEGQPAPVPPTLTYYKEGQTAGGSGESK